VAAKLAEAARMIAATPGALQLRLYQTLVEVSGEARSTIVFPLPIDFSAMSPHAAGNPAQMQAMMQSAVALARAEEQKQLADAGEQIPDPLARAKARVRE